MRVKKTNLSDLQKLYTHPSAQLFRSIELKTIWQKLRDTKFQQPSLDLGSGDGAIARLLFDEQFTYGVDNGEANDYQISIKNKVYKRVLLESAESMSLPNNSLRFIFSNSVIEHIPNNEGVLAEVSRVLKRGGDFVFTAPSHLFRTYLYGVEKCNEYHMPWLGNAYSNKRNQLLNHYHLYSHDQWRNKLARHNMKMTQHAYYIPKEALMLWDKMAIEIVMRKSLGDKRAEKRVFVKNEEMITKYHSQSVALPTSGASVLICAIKL